MKYEHPVNMCDFNVSFKDKFNTSAIVSPVIPDAQETELAGSQAQDLPSLGSEGPASSLVRVDLNIKFKHEG